MGDPHLTHSFEWCFSGKNSTSVTCNKAGRVEDVLRQSSQFRRISEKNKDRELVIVRNGKAISAHFPCSLIEKEHLILRYVKAPPKQKQHASGSVCPSRKSGELVTFHVLSKGGKNVVKIMRNPALNKVVQEVTVYAYKGEKVKQALRRDGRFLQTIFRKNCVLSDTSTEVNTEMSNLVDDLDGQTYKIVLLNKSSPTQSPPGSLDDAYLTQSESLRSDLDENQDSQQLTTTEPENDNAQNKKLKPNDNTAPRKVLHEISGSTKMRNLLSKDFRRFKKGMKTRGSSVENVLCVEFGKSAQTSSEVKTMERLMELSGSVCQVRINGGAEGSGFLLFDKFVLTNAHVIQNIYNDNRRQLDGTVTVNFSFKSLGLQGGGEQPGADVVVEEIVGFENGYDASGYRYDWALLRLRDDEKLPVGLLPQFGFIPHSGGIHIIGHPDGGVKKIDSCLIVSSDAAEDCRQVPVNLISQRFFKDMSDQFNKQVLAYNTCFYFSSSGSPVFDTYCRVVAMHSGGYTEGSVNNGLKHLVEFGYPLSAITEHIIIQIVERQRLDVLKKYLACSYTHHPTMIANVKKLVESRNNTAFKNTVNNSLTEKDPSLRSFFEFFCLKEEPLPMDIHG